MVHCIIIYFIHDYYFYIIIVPTAPTLLTVIASGQDSLTVTWKPPKFANGEIISYKIAVNPGAIVIKSDGSGTEFVVTGLESYTNYSIKVQACTSQGCGPFSNEILSTTLLDGEDF